jgi:hypothetical protein
MRFLADANFPGEAVIALRAAGHDVAWVRTEAPGSTDRVVLERAVAETRILVTFDKDFDELAWRFGLPADDTRSDVREFEIGDPKSFSISAIRGRSSYRDAGRRKNGSVRRGWSW